MPAQCGVFVRFDVFFLFFFSKSFFRKFKFEVSQILKKLQRCSWVLREHFQEVQFLHYNATAHVLLVSGM